MSQRMEEPKTVGECWAVFKRFGFMKPELPLDDSLFPNALQLVQMHNAHLDEIERFTAANTAMREVLEWYEDDANWCGILTGSSNIHVDGGERAQSVLEKIQKNDSEAVILRPEVSWFAEQMELTLRRNDHKGGWKECSFVYLYQRLNEEIQELGNEYFARHFHSEPKWEGILREAPDVANFAMMLADLARRTIDKKEGERHDQPIESP
ncbi:hypothetical protein [Paenibacillus tyrfis]|uniref:hypothetical protein n=1 Tax=Paenibacillus tyrfis TaxID=1501230 RepID=UPI0015C66F14|nr:hypothetical protein [Paenibacillus tyrfis]